MKNRLHEFSVFSWITPGLLLLLNLPLGAQSPALTNSTPTTPSVAQEAATHDPKGPYAEALKELREEWVNLAKERDDAQKEVRMLKSLAPLIKPMAVAEEKKMEADLMPPERESLARNATAPFVEPNVLRSKNGVLVATITAAYAHNKIGSDPVFLRNYDGKLVGPTIRVKPGDKLKLTVRNEMPTEATPVGLMNQLNSFNTTNMHYHGLHVSPYGNSDNVLLTIEPKGSQFYEVDIPKDHPAGTYWYHAHHHGSTAGNVSSGMSGALIIEGGLDDIPEIKAAEDRTFVLNQIPYIYKNTFQDPPNPPVVFDLPEGRVELEYANYIFGPGDWGELGRFTTVNGIQLPVLRMRPGAMERWRFVASGQRELIKLKLMRVPGTKVELPEILPLNEIATDGLALGKVYTQDTIDLWPGYRSDVLIQAPLEAGEYLLIDEQTPGDKSMNGIPESRKHIARLIIEGKPLAKAMPLPTDASMAGLRLPSIKESEVTGPPQEAVYGIIKQGSGIAFTIDRKSFNMDSARQLTLGKVDEWHLTSKNEVGPVSHPYHIHVNPFEVISMKDDKGVEQLKEPVWRDTIILNENWEVRMRTRYEDFTGVFVQHCHILDHEDQGMMQLVEIVDPTPPAPPAPAPAPAPAKKKDAKSGAAVIPAPTSREKGLTLGAPAPAFTLPDGQGKPRKLSDFAGKPTALFFFKGHACLHCSLQVAAFLKQAEEFQKKGIQLVGITTDTVADLGKALEAVPCPFPILADPDHKIFHKYACYGDGILHGTFLLDAAGKVQWQTIGKTPYMDVNTLLGQPAETQRQTASVNLSPDSASVPKPVASAVLSAEAASSIQTEVIEAGGADTAAAETETRAAEKAARLTADPTATPKIEIEIRNTSAASDDYLTWAPAPARIRQVPPVAGGRDLTVVLGNDAEQAVPAGRKLPLDGNLAFAATVQPGQTASAATLNVTLPANGDWVPFIVAGAYPRSSTADKDAIIEVRSHDASQTLLGTQAAMVRVRKDHRLLTDTEKKRFLSALAHLRYDVIDASGTSRYMHYVYMHRAAALGIRYTDPEPPPELKYYWPDLAHKGPGFIAWHRAFLLQFERDLQKNFPDVSLPYWIMPEPAVLFQDDFIGANIISSTQPWVNPSFAVDNPLHGWTAKIPEDDGPGTDGLIRRSPINRNPKVKPFPNFFTDDFLFKTLAHTSQYSLYPAVGVPNYGFVDAMEQNPHNIGHNWCGEWMQNCATSPRDPVFWVFHTGFDRQWAHWQYLNNRFDPSGKADSFCPLGTYENPQPNCGPPTIPGDCAIEDTNSCIPVNHHSADKLWPWNGKSGQGANAHGNYPQPDMAAPFTYPFAAAPIPGLWPKTEVQPTAGDMADYLGLFTGLEMGFVYDDTPYGKQPSPALIPVVKPADLKLFANASKPAPERLAAASRLMSTMPTTQENVDAVADVLEGTHQDESVRLEAFNLLKHNSEDWMDDASGLLSSPEKSTPALAVEAIKSLSTALMQSGLNAEEHKEVVATLEKSLADPRPPVRLEALRALAPMGHSKAVVPALTASLGEGNNGGFTPAQAIKGLMSAGAAQTQAALIRPHLDSPDPEVRSAAVSALTGDVASRAAIQKILADRTQPDSVRLPAIQALLTGGSDYFDGVLALAADSQENDALRAQAVATLRAALSKLKEAQLQQVVARLGALPIKSGSPLESVLSQTLRSATQRLKPKP